MCSSTDLLQLSTSNKLVIVCNSLTATLPQLPELIGISGGRIECDQFSVGLNFGFPLSLINNYWVSSSFAQEDLHSSSKQKFGVSGLNFFKLNLCSLEHDCSQLSWTPLIPPITLRTTRTTLRKSPQMQQVTPPKRRPLKLRLRHHPRRCCKPWATQPTATWQLWLRVRQV